MSLGITFLALLACGFAGLFTWAFRHLPEEQWQFLAAVPTAREREGHFRAINLTFYGLWLAAAVVFATASFLVLARALAVAAVDLAVIAALLLAVALPAARLLARLIERKRATLTVGGAVFVAFLVAPAVIAGLALGTGRALPALALLAALGIAYNFGEGLGRLACLSFGCCYGRPLASLSRPWRRLFAPFALRFVGGTKKAAYEGGYEGVPLVPIQAITAVVLTGLGLVGCGCFLAGSFRAAFLVTLVGSQLWRVLSEVLRADHRGGGRLTAYQKLALLAVPWALFLAFYLPAGAGEPDLAAGLALLWQSAALLALEALGLAVFVYTGISQVTGAHLAFHVHRHEV